MGNDPIEMLGKRGNEFLRAIRKNALKISIYMLIVGILMGVIFILVGGDNIWLYFSKTILMFMVIAVLAVISSINFKIIEIGNRGAQIFALMGLVLNFVWAILWMLCIWDAFSLVSYTDCFSNVSFYNYGRELCSNGISLMGKITLIVTAVSAYGLIGSLILAVKNYDKRGALLPLKITSVIGLSYDLFFIVAMIIIDWNIYRVDERFVIMAGFAAVVWIVTVVIGAIISQRAKERLEAGSEKPKTEEIR